MDKGWGLTLDSDPGTKFFPNKTNSGGPFFRLKQQRDMFQFPVSLAGFREDHQGTSSSSSPSGQEKRPVAVDEVDFFSDKKTRVVVGGDDKTGTVSVKKETSHGEAAPGSDLDVNVSGLKKPFPLNSFTVRLNYCLIFVSFCSKT